MLIELLRHDPVLPTYFCDICAENDIGININDSISDDNILIIKIDDYYNHLVEKPDYSPDCMIIQKCSENIFNIYIIELRNIANPNGFRINDIYQKFITCLEDFMSIKFANYFHNNLFELQSIQLLFITDPYNFRQNPEKQLYMRGLRIDNLIARRIPKYFNKFLYIQHRLPNPTIPNCS